MLQKDEVLELIKSEKSIYVLHWFSFDSRINIVKHNLDSNYSVKDETLYYKNKVVNELLFCYEDIDLKKFVDGKYIYPNTSK